MGAILRALKMELFTVEFCPNCHLPLNGHPQCLSCNRNTGDVATEILGPVTWDEVATHLKSKLFMDTEWIVEEGEELTWYPWLFPVRIYARAQGTFDNSPDNWMLVTSEIELVEVDENRGIDLAADLNREFNLGVFVYEEGRLRVQTTLALNPLCRGLLDLFHDQVLAQATIAFKLSAEFEDYGLKLLFAEHPVSGFHETPDELLGVFLDELQLPIADGYLEQVELVRNGLFRDLMVKDGFEIGFDQADVTYYESATTWVGAGVMNDQPKFAKYGPGMMLAGMFAEHRFRFDAFLANETNLVIGRVLPCSQFGPISAVYESDGPEITSTMWVQLTYGFLAVNRLDSVQLAVAMKNVALHINSAVRLFGEYYDSLVSE
jgi:hypothetical protein